MSLYQPKFKNPSYNLSKWEYQCGSFLSISVAVLDVVVFPQAPFRATNVPRPTLVSSNCATAPWLPEEAVGDYVTPFVLERLFDYSCSVEFAGSYYRHVPCKFRKVCLGLKYLPQINYGGN